MKDIIAKLEEKREAARAGGGEKRHASQHAKGKLTATKVVKRKSIKTLNGERVRVRVRGSKVYVAGARVTTPDVTASNGVIHVINKVLIPR